MTTRYDYSLLEFTSNLAEAEASYGQKLQSIIETFSQSRLDLPLKRLSDIAKVHSRTAANLKKFMDPKKNEHLNLWKMCNVYSCGAVDLDKAMRETRSSLRTKMALDGTVIEKPKRRNIFNSIHTHLNSYTSPHSSGPSEKSEKAEKPERPERRWFPKRPDRKADSRHSRKNTASSLEPEEEKHEARFMNGSQSTPPTPPAIRAPHAPLKASASVAPETLKPPRPPFRSTAPEPPVTNPPALPQASIPVNSPIPQFYATTIYDGLQKASSVGLNNNNRGGFVEEHSLRHTDDSSKEPSVVRIRTDVDVSRETKQNETTVNIYDSSPAINKSHYVNVRPPIAQKPKMISPDRIDDVAPTFISVDCYQSTTVPTPSPRTYYHTTDIPLSQRSSSSAYSSNYSSSSNVTSFVVDNSSSASAQNPTEVVENARYVRVISPDGIHRF